MATLSIFSDTDHGATAKRIVHPAAVAAALEARGIRHQSWPVLPGIVPGTSPETVLQAYAAAVARVQTTGGYKAVDVVSIAPDDPERAAKRAKFLTEHTHREDEVRFFAAGGGLFSLHLGSEVVQVKCSAGDLLVVPDGTRHWFDMGPAPAFVAIRWFTDPAGWVAYPTGWADCVRYPAMVA